MGFIAARTLQPQPIPLIIKIILIGDPYIYQLLYTYDEDFRKFFKIKAQFDWRDEEDRRARGRVLRPGGRLLQRRKAFAHRPDRHGPPDRARPGAGRHQEKLTLQLKDVLDVVKEANYWARTNDPPGDQRGRTWKRPSRKRPTGSDLPEEKLQEFIDEGMLFIETAGAGGGPDQRPVGLRPGGPRLRAPHPHHRHLSLGKEGVVAIDREAKLAGNIHNKGVLILASFLKSRFAQEQAPDPVGQPHLRAELRHGGRATAPPWRNS